jgi:hypothetical protein
MTYPTTEILEELPVLIEGQADNCHIDTGDFRVWLSRTGIEDGEPYDNTVTIEEHVKSPAWGWQWVEFEVYDGDDPPQVIPGLTPDVFRGEY